MGCFLAPAAAAVVTTRLKKKIAPKYHLEWLNAMLWGGVVMLVVEHLAHGEIVPFPPFLTAIQNPAEISTMLKEIATVGTAMTVAIILVWAVMIFVVNKAEKMREKKIQIVTA